MATVELLAPLHAEMTAWRQDIHAHPELGFEENRTAGLVAAKLEAFGIDEVHRGVGRTGVVGVLRAGARHPLDRPARRHGRAADPRGQPLRPLLGEQGRDARLRPRRPHRDAARRGALPGGDAPLRRHGPLHLPAGRGRPRRRPGDDRRRPVRALSLPGDLRHAQPAEPGGGPLRGARRADDGRRRLLRHPRHRQGRARRAAGDRRRSGAGRGADRRQPAEHRLAQRGAGGHRRAVGDAHPRRRCLQRHPAKRRAGRHGARLLARRDAAGGKRDAPRRREHRRGLRRDAPKSTSARCSRPPSTMPPKPTSPRASAPSWWAPTRWIATRR